MVDIYSKTQRRADVRRTTYWVNITHVLCVCVCMPTKNDRGATGFPLFIITIQLSQHIQGRSLQGARARPVNRKLQRSQWLLSYQPWHSAEPLVETLWIKNAKKSGVTCGASRPDPSFPCPTIMQRVFWSALLEPQHVDISHSNNNNCFRQ